MSNFHLLALLASACPQSPLLERPRCSTPSSSRPNSLSTPPTLNHKRHRHDYVHIIAIACAAPIPAVGPHLIMSCNIKSVSVMFSPGNYTTPKPTRRLFLSGCCRRMYSPSTCHRPVPSRTFSSVASMRLCSPHPSCGCLSYPVCTGSSTSPTLRLAASHSISASRPDASWRWIAAHHSSLARRTQCARSCSDYDRCLETDAS